MMDAGEAFGFLSSYGRVFCLKDATTLVGRKAGQCHILLEVNTHAISYFDAVCTNVLIDNHI